MEETEWPVIVYLKRECLLWFGGILFMGFNDFETQFLIERVYDNSVAQYFS